LEFIPSLPCLTNLYCVGATKISEIPYLPMLITLNCSYTRFKSLPLLPKLKYLRCDYSRIESLPEFPDLRQLMCWYVVFREIPYFPKLEAVFCNPSLIIKKMPPLCQEFALNPRLGPDTLETIKSSPYIKKSYKIQDVDNF
jgi:Leucine-rich repeat (LRR) protein